MFLFPGRLSARYAAWACIVLSLLLGGCAASPKNICRPGEQAARMDTLYFGTLKRHEFGPVTRAEWREFVMDVITPRFPQGLTWWKAHGHWKTDSGPVERETAYVLQVVHPEAESIESAVAEVSRRYKQKFDQEAVYQVGSPACVQIR